MSLVNKMLQDLNARNAQEVANHLPEQVRVMPGQTASRWLSQRSVLPLSVVGLGVLATLLAWQWDGVTHWAGELGEAAISVATVAPASVPLPATTSPGDTVATESTPGTVEAAVATVSGHEVPPLAEALPPLPPGLAVSPPAQEPGGRAAVRSQPMASLQLRVAESLSMLSHLASHKPVVAVPAKSAGMTPQRPTGGADTGHAAGAVEQEAGAVLAGMATRPPEAQAVARSAVSAPVSVASVESARAPARVERIERGERVDERLQRALMAYHQGRVDEAIQKLQDILSTQPRQVEARQALLSVQLERNHHAEAMQLLTEGLLLLPARTDWAMALARLQVDEGNVQGALATLQQHQTQAQGHADYLGFMGVLQQHLKLHHEAVQSYQAALRLKPREGRWWYALGLSLEADQQTEAAREAFLKARGSGGLTAVMNEAIAKRLQAP